MESKSYLVKILRKDEQLEFKLNAQMSPTDAMLTARNSARELYGRCIFKEKPYIKVIQLNNDKPFKKRYQGVYQNGC